MFPRAGVVLKGGGMGLNVPSSQGTSCLQVSEMVMSDPGENCSLNKSYSPS
jgi:hypothetical protein